MPSALGGFVEGLQGGMKFRQDTKRNRRVDQLLDLEYEKGALDQWGQRGDVDAAREGLGLSPMDWDQYSSDVDDDPYGGFGGKLKNLFSPKNMLANFKRNAGIDSGNPTALARNERAIEDATAGADASSMGGRAADYGALQGARFSADGGPVRMANGGSVESQLDELNRSNPKPRPAGVEAQLDKDMTPDQRARAEARRNPSRTRQALRTGGRRLAKAGRIARGASGVGATVAGVQGAAKGFGTETDDYRERYTMPEMLMHDDDDSALTMFGKDLGARAIGVGNDVGRSAMNLMGMGGDDQVAAIRASDVASQPAEDQGPIDIGELPTMTVRGQQPQQSQAVPDDRGGPVQFADAPIVMPNEMPSMGTQEWAAYRATSVDRLVARGMTLPQAHDAVTSMQQKGFLNYGMQAFQLLQAGDPARASMALKAAYQYFPNGADVKFGMTKDKQGQPALVAMGTNEETGEAVGQPMLITQERLGVMMENMSDPSAFRTWTKDWREFEQDIRKYYEIDKPEAESNARYRDRMGQAAVNRSEADLAASYQTGGLKRSDIDRNSKEFRTAMQEMGLLETLPRPDQTYLSRIMSAMFLHHGMEQNEVIDEVTAAYDSGQIPALLEKYGLSNAPEQGE
jgi:hypothetical protein